MKREEEGGRRKIICRDIEEDESRNSRGGSRRFEGRMPRVRRSNRWNRGGRSGGSDGRRGKWQEG